MDRPILTPETLLAHDRYVRVLARALVFDPSLAEDVAQETWLAALANAPRNQGSLRAWLAQIARNLAFRMRRGQERRVYREMIAARPDAVPSAEEVLERETARRSLVEAVFALEEPYRSTLVLRYFEDLPPREVARRLGVPVETARTRIKRGLEMLRARLDREHGSGRSAWCVALVRELRLQPSSYIRPALACLKPAVVGGLAMAALNKITAGVLVIAICFLLLLVWSRNQSSRVATKETTPSVVLSPTVAEEPPAVSRAPDDAERAARVAVSEPVPSSAPYGSLRVRVEWDDGRPAPDIRASVVPMGDGDYVFRELQVRTGDDGAFLLDKVHAGDVYVRLDRGVTAGTKVESGQETTLSMRIEPGFEVEGIVENIEGVPVPDAEVWLTQLNALDTGHPVARSGADGRFRIHGVQKRNGEGMRVAAIAPGYAPSSFGRMTGSVGASVPIRLVLPGPGGEVKGTVIGPDGRGIADADVRINSQNSSGVYSGGVLKGSRDGTEWEPSDTVVVRTDANGAFRAGSLPLGEAQLYVKARGLVSWLGKTQVGTQPLAETTIHLEAGASLAGTVSDSTGKPAPNVEIRALPEDDLLQQVTQSAADGFYLLRGLPSGKATIQASADVGRMATTTLVIGELESVRWDAVLTPGETGVIRGRVVDEQGRPLVGWRVIATRNLGFFYGGMADNAPRTDADGRFHFEGLAKTPYCVAVASPGKRTSLFADATVQPVLPGPDDLLVRVMPETRPSAFIHGRVVDPQGKPAENVRITLRLQENRYLDTHGIAEMTAAGTGEFHLGPYVPGHWHLQLDAFGYPRYYLQSHELHPGEVLDLGTIQLEQGGSIVIRLRREDETGVGHPYLCLIGTTWNMLQIPEVEGESVMLGPLPPGAYRLVVQGAPDERTACGILPFEIRAGETARSEMILQPGVMTIVRFRSPDPAPPGNTITYSVLDRTGKALFEYKVRPDPAGAYEQKIGCLARGHYRMEAERQDGHRAIAEFDVGQAGVAPETHEFEILPP